MSAPFTAGDVVQVHRPGRACHEWVGRYLDKDAHQSDFAWVSFGRSGAVHAPPDEKHYKKIAYTQHKLFPLSQLTKHPLT